MLRKLSQALIFTFIFSLVSANYAQAYNPVAACNISSENFNSWFVSGSATHNGPVTFANSVDFPTNNTVCDFYKWSHQMFLWATSPLGQSIVLESTAFYDVVFDSNGNGVFVSSTSDSNNFTLRGSKPQRIQAAGQAGGADTLLTLNGSLVYFGVNVNDVYAWFNTAVTNGVITPDTVPFPTTRGELKKITDYAASKGTTLIDADALTMEFKTAWIDADTISKSERPNYIIIEANVPNYVGAIGDTTWTVSSTTPTVQKSLALVGMHVVGPVQGHPEMVWATIEHERNAPDNDYYVEAPLSLPIPITHEVPYNSDGNWNFMTDGGEKSGALVSQMVVGSSTNKHCTTGKICATAGNGIIANNVYRAMPWGNAPTPASANNNSQLISLNNDIRGFLVGNDVRQNYFQSGAVWTRDGSVPANGNDTSKQVGSKLLANTTMETYHQKNMNGCFGCHNNDGNSKKMGTYISHLFSTKNLPLVPK
ncbi:MAG: hypothetical protein ACJAQ6_001342 [Arenicella sp.]|jgi:hypothetical protein